MVQLARLACLCRKTTKKVEQWNEKKKKKKLKSVQPLKEQQRVKKKLKMPVCMCIAVNEKDLVCYVCTFFVACSNKVHNAWEL